MKEGKNTMGTQGVTASTLQSISGAASATTALASGTVEVASKTTALASGTLASGAAASRWTGRPRAQGSLQGWRWQLEEPLEAPRGRRSPPSRLAEEGKGKPETRLRVPSPSEGTLGDSGGEGYP